MVRRALKQSERQRRDYFHPGAPAPTVLWRALGALGVTGLALDPPGFETGSSIIEQVLVAEELGRTTTPAPFAVSAAANQLLAASLARFARDLLSDAIDQPAVLADLGMMIDDHIRVGRELQTFALRPGLLAPLAFGSAGPVQPAR